MPNWWYQLKEGPEYTPVWNPPLAVFTPQVNFHWPFSSGLWRRSRLVSGGGGEVTHVLLSLTLHAVGPKACRCHQQHVASYKQYHNCKRQHDKVLDHRKGNKSVVPMWSFTASVMTVMIHSGLVCYVRYYIFPPNVIAQHSMAFTVCLFFFQAPVNIVFAPNPSCTTFLHQRQHLCCGSGLCLRDKGVPAPLKQQKFENRFQNVIFW